VETFFLYQLKLVHKAATHTQLINCVCLCDLCIKICDLWCLIKCILLLITTVTRATFCWLLNIQYDDLRLVAKSVVQQPTVSR
jgi:hypothetical protein